MADAITHTLSAPAKLNLRLRIVGRRSDGMHRLESDMVLIDLVDEVTLQVRSDNDIVRAWQHPNISDEQDLCLRAAHRLRDKSGYRHGGVSIHVSKKIPLGSGLGGGSSDAAAVLIGLNRLWQLNWSVLALADLAATLGADVPFFLFGSSARVSGIGNQLSTLKLPINNYLLVFPAVSSMTATVYAEYQWLTRSAKIGRIPPALEKSENDLTLPALRLYPAIVSAAVALCRVASEARLSGSGSTVFAEFVSAQQAHRARSGLPSNLPSAVVVGLEKHPLLAMMTRETLA